MGGGAAGLGCLAAAVARLPRHPGSLGRDGRAARGGPARDPRPGCPSAGCNAGGTVGPLRRRHQTRGRMIDISVAADRDVPRETIEKLEAYAAMVAEENQRQNLVSRATIDTFWDRHIVDSAQLVRLEPFAGASWLD